MFYWLLYFCKHHLIGFSSSKRNSICSFSKETLLITSKGTTTKKVGVAALGDKILNSTAFGEKSLDKYGDRKHLKRIKLSSLFRKQQGPSIVHKSLFGDTWTQGLSC